MKGINRPNAVKVLREHAIKDSENCGHDMSHFATNRGRGFVATCRNCNKLVFINADPAGLNPWIIDDPDELMKTQCPGKEKENARITLSSLSK